MSYSTDPVLDASRYYDALDAANATHEAAMQENATLFIAQALCNSATAVEHIVDVVSNYKDFDARLCRLLMARYGKDAELTKLVNDIAQHWAWLNTEEV